MPNTLSISNYLINTNLDVLLLSFLYLDLQSLTRAVQVCKEWRSAYKNMHKGKVFKEACFEIWNNDLYRATLSFLKRFRSWRKMFFDRPRISVRGFYVCQACYAREGLCDVGIYNPIHSVAYFVYLRFYEDGRFV